MILDRRTDHACSTMRCVDIMNRMARLQLNLPDELQAAAEKRAVAGGYGTVDNYIASLIEADEIAPISDSLEAELLKGLDSGDSVEITSEFLSDLKSRARANRGNAA